MRFLSENIISDLFSSFPASAKGHTVDPIRTSLNYGSESNMFDTKSNTSFYDYDYDSGPGITNYSTVKDLESILGSSSSSLHRLHGPSITSSSSSSSSRKSDVFNDFLFTSFVAPPGTFISKIDPCSGNASPEKAIDTGLTTTSEVVPLPKLPDLDSNLPILITPQLVRQIRTEQAQYTMFRDELKALVHDPAEGLISLQKQANDVMTQLNKEIKLLRSQL